MLLSLFVRYKKQGIGQKLLEATTEELKRRCYLELLVPSHIRWQEAWLFYDKMGYERVGQVDVGGLVQVWRKDLL